MRFILPINIARVRVKRIRSRDTPRKPSTDDAAPPNESIVDNWQEHELIGVPIEIFS